MANPATASDSSTQAPQRAAPSKIKLPPLPREAVIAILFASFELERNGSQVELENQYIDPETLTMYMGVPNFADGSITLHVHEKVYETGRDENGKRLKPESKQYTIPAELARRWKLADL